MCSGDNGLGTPICRSSSFHFHVGGYNAVVRVRGKRSRPKVLDAVSERLEDDCETVELGFGLC